MSNQQISVEPLGLNNNKHTLLLDKISTGSQLSKREFESVMTQIRAFKIRTFYFIQKYSKSLSAKERKEGKIVTYTTSELNELFTKSNEFS
jgi:hypothetical protein